MQTNANLKTAVFLTIIYHNIFIFIIYHLYIYHITDLYTRLEFGRSNYVRPRSINQCPNRSGITHVRCMVTDHLTSSNQKVAIDIL